MLAPYASNPAVSRGRLHFESPSTRRDAFQRDRDRIIHSTAFRRLKHKTQVFVSPDGDHFRTRLTHSLEVAQIGRAIARTLQLNEDLTEALCLAHDLGHPPFGHVGEDVLAARMAPWGGFDHNGHTIRMLTTLEVRYADFDGLNLSWETLEGLAKHNGPVASPGWALGDYNALHDLDLGTHAGPEAQLAALADDIAYDNHDLDDGLRAGLFTLDEVAAAVPLVAECLDAVRARHPGAPEDRLAAELVRFQIGRMADDLIEETVRRLAALAPADVDAVRSAGASVVGFSEAMQAAERDLKRFLYANMYFHTRNLAMREPAAAVTGELFDKLHDDPSRLPADWLARLPEAEPARARHIADFIAGMTDRYALKTFEALGGQIVFPPGAII
ncbi:deoxyguanosinetriphosphate triphosphohydrolase [Sphingosinicella microcystinivorans]|uniref:Deoxyguanosinetriphosphate triphosphohydrolase-like protein n=1 Tax=Sphingosinicella microcystinivorans TaxID=335406 RepID=A0AAD1D9F7_SPHMI|nr:deoxyguanosinetriphosphate triphosphohydrolase [Sphingosinicella microcystinivorans]RKS88056.1 dGTPase [Sphingosinicella microcystinivorans]BBE35867.1 deoxyguanosinetriphosphate triphosphohydrolase-like protein [Sphingosinicella microcystinivorans]